MMFGKSQPRVATHDGGCTVPQEPGLGTGFAIDQDTMVRVGIVISWNGWMMRHLLRNIHRLRSVLEFIPASKEFAKHWIVWFFHTLHKSSMLLELVFMWIPSSFFFLRCRPLLPPPSLFFFWFFFFLTCLGFDMPSRQKVLYNTYKPLRRIR